LFDKVPEQEIVGSGRPWLPSLNSSFDLAEVVVTLDPVTTGFI